MKKSPNPKVALIYDRVNTTHGGAEKVLLALHKAFPKAPLYTSVYDSKKADWAKVFEVKTTWLQKIPFASKLHRWLAALMPIAFESLDLSEYDIVISVTSAEAKGAITNSNQLHICYLLTPTRYLYQHREHSLESNPFLDLPPIKWLANKFLDYLTWWDQIAATRPDIIIPISHRVADRVAQYYPYAKADKVIYPPVEFEIEKNKNQKQDNSSKNEKYYLIVSRLVSYKKIELAIQACNSLQKNLVIVGAGPEKKKLKKLTTIIKANHLITFLENVPGHKLKELYQNCQAVIMPGEEDFGIVALEANAHGKPILINHKSGAAELIEHGKHGLHIAHESINGIIKSIQQLEEINSKQGFNYEEIIQNPQKYGTNMFIEKFSQLVKTKWENKNYD